MPVSSSGHLALAGWVLGVDSGLSVAIGVHFGTALAVVALYWRPIIDIIAGFFRGVTKRDGSARLAGCLVVTSIPAAVIGLIAEDAVDRAFSSPAFVAVGLLITGVVLWFVQTPRNSKRATRSAEINYAQAGAIGLAQAVAILPGVSRSGLTISSALAVGLERQFAAEYSFIASLPVILGGVILYPFTSGQGLASMASQSILMAAAAAALSGAFAIVFLRNLVRQGKLRYFSYYVWAVAIITLLLRAGGMRPAG